MGNHLISIDGEEAYKIALKKIDSLTKKGESKLNDKKAEKLKLLSSAVKTYEKSVYTVTAPKTLKDLIELKMYEHKLNQKGLAKLLGVGEAKLSQIISKKRKADVAFLKAAREKLDIDGNILLEYA